MRGLIAGLATPAPLSKTLPSMLREDAFARELCAALDEVLAPILLSLDSFPAYLDVGTTPDDMLPWLAQWVGLTVEHAQERGGQRDLLRTARDMHALQGTKHGIELAVKAALGVEVEVSESGGTAWSERADADLPGDAVPAIVVTVRPGPGQDVDVDHLNEVVRAVRPAHVQYKVTVTEQS